MRESSGTDSFFGEDRCRNLAHWTRACVCCERSRRVRREAAECVDVSASSAIKWMQRLNETGSIAAKPSGGSISPLEAHADFLLGLIAAQPDLTLDEIVAVMRKRRIAGSRSAVWRFFVRHNISFKKKPARRGAAASGCGPRTATLDARTRHV